MTERLVLVTAVMDLFQVKDLFFQIGFTCIKGLH